MHINLPISTYCDTGTSTKDCINLPGYPGNVKINYTFETARSAVIRVKVAIVQAKRLIKSAYPKAVYHLHPNEKEVYVFYELYLSLCHRTTSDPNPLLSLGLGVFRCISSLPIKIFRQFFCH